jgi:hypothetical protein
VIGLTACGFEHGAFMDGDGSGIDAGSGSGSAGIDASNGTPDDSTPACGWSYTPTNFDPCALPAPGMLEVTSDLTLNTGSTSLPKLTLTQSDGTPLTVIHLSTLSVHGGSTLTVTGTAFVFAVDGNAQIDGKIVAVGGESDATQCAQAFGAPGVDSTDGNSGAGGAGGGGAAERGGNGTNGAGGQAGARGEAGTKVTSASFSPLRGGCRGGAGGRAGGSGIPADAGRGGGALQISTDSKITVTLGGSIDAAGRGGGGAVSARDGGGGGGSGGSIFLEGPRVQLDLNAHLCADGGSGGEGGGNTVDGNSGSAGACNGLGGAGTQSSGSYGGDGGRGSYWFTRNGGDAGGALGSGGGGGGGGAVGWIRIKSPDSSNGGAIVTPLAI